jgi:Peptidase family M1 domain/Peptidase M1 N-terminal domain
MSIRTSYISHDLSDLKLTDEREWGPIMRRLMILLFVAIGVVTGGSAFAEIPDSPLQTFVQRVHDQALAGEQEHACSHGKVVHGLDKSWYSIADDSTHNYNSLHLDIQLTPDIGSNTFVGTVLMTAEANQELSNFYINLKDCNVSQILVDGVVASYNYTGETLTITPATAISAGAEFTVETEYDGFIYNTNASGGMVKSPSTNTVFTFGEPYDTRRWLPCFDFPFDKVTSDMRVTMDTEYEVLSNGLLESVTDHGNGTHTYHWINEEQTSTYLLAFSAGPYVVVNDEPAGANNTPVAYWILPQYQAQAEYDFGRTDDMINYFEPLFGIYPFVKYDQAMAAIFGGWGAMEHQTATTFGHSLVNTGSRHYEHIVAHELGHQWWGDYVGPRTFANIWLNEGFASYTEALWAENFSEEDRQVMLAGFRSQFYSHDSNTRHPIYDPPNGHLFCTTIYKKGGWILHMLRWVVGDQNFFDGLQHYADLHGFESASSPDFQAAMEAVSGMDLTSFFDEWVYGQGYPEYITTNLKIRQVGNEYELNFRLYQVQQNAPYFSTPIPIMVREKVSEAPVVYRNTIVRAEVEAVYGQNVVLGGFSLPPDSFEFDPQEWLLGTSEYRANVEDELFLPQEFEVTAGWPNPFNSTVSFEIRVHRPMDVRAVVFDVLGREVAVVADESYWPGKHQISWTPSSGVASGTYLLQVNAGEQTEIRKLVFLQ